MRKILIVTHGLYAHGLRDTLTMFGFNTNVEALCLDDKGIEVLKEKFNTELQIADEALVFVDIEGGSPYQLAATAKLEGYPLELVTGVNLPMVLEAAVSGENLSLLETAQKAVATGNKGISLFELATASNEDDE